MINHFNSIVIGGGVIGLTAAIGMKMNVDNVALIDAGSMSVNTDKHDPRVYAINHASEQLFKKLGVWQLLDTDRIKPYRGMKVFDSTTDANIEFDSRMTGSNKLGFIIEESILKKALLSRAGVLGIELIVNQPVTNVVTSKEKTTVSCEHQSYDTDLLLVADGGQSKTRTLLNVPVTQWSYHQHAVVTRVETEYSHQHAAWQVFNPDGPLAFLPLANEKQCSIVWSTKPNRAKSLVSMSELEFNHAIESAFQSKLGTCRVLEQRIHFPLNMRHVKQYAGENWLLMGDAAHTIHPLAGLGLNLGLEDVATWLEMVEQNNRPVNSKTKLAVYQRNRKAQVWKMILAMQGLKSVFSSAILPVKTIRGAGLQAINHMPLMKKFFIAQASGIRKPIF